MTPLHTFKPDLDKVIHLLGPNFSSFALHQKWIVIKQFVWEWRKKKNTKKKFKIFNLEIFIRCIFSFKKKNKIKKHFNLTRLTIRFSLRLKIYVPHLSETHNPASDFSRELSKIVLFSHYLWVLFVAMQFQTTWNN